jgi:hypothetical protein
MHTIQVDLQRTFPRKFVPKDADMGDWSQVEPLFKQLLNIRFRRRLIFTALLPRGRALHRADPVHDRLRQVGQFGSGLRHRERRRCHRWTLRHALLHVGRAELRGCDRLRVRGGAGKAWSSGVAAGSMRSSAPGAGSASMPTCCDGWFPTSPSATCTSAGRTGSASTSSTRPCA